jgi:hypothetical protein
LADIEDLKFLHQINLWSNSRTKDRKVASMKRSGIEEFAASIALDSASLIEATCYHASRTA